MKHLLLISCFCCIYIQVLAQDVKVNVLSSNSGFTININETITSSFEIINTSSPDISICGQNYKIEYMSSKNIWTYIRKEIPAITIDYDCNTRVIHSGEKLKCRFNCSLMHPNFNSFIQPDLEYSPNTILLRVMKEYYQENVLKYTYSEPFTVNVNPLSQEDSNYNKWLNERHIFGFWARDINIEAYDDNKTGWRGSAETNPALYHNFTSDEVEEAMALFPKSILLGLNLSRALYSPIDDQLHMPRELLIKILTYIGNLNDADLIQEHKYKILSICGNGKDHSCEEYKRLAPLYGLSK